MKGKGTQDSLTEKHNSFKMMKAELILQWLDISHQIDRLALYDFISYSMFIKI